MTPMAVRLFRQGDETHQKLLASAQYFECTRLVPMALDMVTADVEAGSDVYSRMAQLPAPVTAMEFMFAERRLLTVLTQQEDRIEWLTLGEFEGFVEFLFDCGFVLGSSENLPMSWNEDYLKWWAEGLERNDTKAFGRQQAVGMNGVLEKMLCIINQPGLVERMPRDTDKRALRLAAKAKLSTPAAKWHDCKIRPGVHGKGDADNSTGREHQLHYVRKHLKPSLGPERWVDGYWRGNVDLGIHLKNYIASPPTAAVQQ